MFTDDERRAIREAADPDEALWIRWAAKEAAFKVVTKLLGAPPPFEHAAFRVRVEDGPRESPVKRPVRATVVHEGRRIRIHGDADADRVHVLARVARHEPAEGAPAADPERDRRARGATLRRRIRRLDRPPPRPADGWQRRFRHRFTEREWRSVHRPVSALVRLEARADLARALGIREREVEIVCDDGPPGRMPPRVMVRSEDYAGDLTLSHHGRFLAWAFSVPDRYRLQGR